MVDAFVAYNGRSSRGFGYVTFKEAGPAKVAVDTMNAEGFVHTWPGAPISEDDKTRDTRVEMARERPKPRPEPRAHGDRRDGDGDRRRDGDGRGRGRGRDGDSRGGKSGEADGEGNKGARRPGGRGRTDGGGRGRGRGRGDSADGVVAAMRNLAVGGAAPAENSAPTVEESSEA